MKRTYLIAALKEYFDIRELVCPHVFRSFGERSWQFFDRDFLEMLLVLRRDIVQAPMTVNNWYRGGTLDERGLRCNICQLVKNKTLAGKVYMTSHANGASIDFDAKGMTAQQVRNLIQSKADLMPCNVRLEDGVSWVHIDVYDQGVKCYLFKP